MSKKNISADQEKLFAINRRQFIKQMGLLGGGLVVYSVMGDHLVQARAPRTGYAGIKVPTDFNAFLKIGADNQVTCFVGKIEMGQGPITSFAQMAAEELNVSYESVTMVMGDTKLCPWDAGTWGSLSTRYYGIFVKEAASEAKGVLKELAGQRLLCPIKDLKVENGVIFDRNSPMSRVTYGELTAGKVITRHLKKLPSSKPHSQYTISGKPFLRRDAFDKVTGKAEYSGDIYLPGMLYASILRPPAHGVKRLKFDTSAAEKQENVRIIIDGDLIAALHPSFDKAQAACALIKAKYDTPAEGLNHQTIFKHLLENTPEPKIVAQNGKLEKGEKKSQTIFEKTYYNSYVAHAPLEPHTALASFENDMLTIWASTQSPFGVQESVAAALNLPIKKVRVITPFVGGGFGGKSASEQAVEAARLARRCGRPVMVAWSREEEFFYDTFRPAAVVKIRSGLDQSQRISFWDYNVYWAGSRGSENFYEIAHHREAAYGQWSGAPGIHPFAVGPWRAPGANTNTFARDLHLNIMAEKAGKDPLEFRLEHLKDQRMRSVLKAAAEKFGYRPMKTPSGRGYGISCGIDAETYVAAMAEVNVDSNSGLISVKRVVCAQDMGQVINPQGATIQMEGCITMGLGYALSEEINFDNGRIFDTNFDTYEIPRFSWLPEIETVLVSNKSIPPKGGGEPAIICMGGVLATAVFDATKIPIYQLPMTKKRVKAALNKRLQTG